jgi:hypothetical protein
MLYKSRKGHTEREKGVGWKGGKKLGKRKEGEE